LLGVAGGSFAPAGAPEPTRWRTLVAVRVRVRDGAVEEWQVFADNEPLRRLLRRG
jgi:hypothetical protein